MFKARMLFTKTDSAKYISHLDVMHVFQRAFLRAKLPLRYSEGFNPHMYVSILLPLSTGFSGTYEIMDFDFMTDKIPENAVAILNSVMAPGICVKEIYEALTPAKRIAYASFRIVMTLPEESDDAMINRITEIFKTGPVMIKKQSKKGETEVDILEYIKKIEILKGEDRQIVINAVLAAGNRSLNPEYITKLIADRLGLKDEYFESYERNGIFTEEMELFK